MTAGQIIKKLIHRQKILNQFSELKLQIHTPFSFDDFPSFINSEIRRGDELKKHYLIYNGVTQLFVK